MWFLVFRCLPRLHTKRIHDLEASIDGETWPAPSVRLLSPTERTVGSALANLHYYIEEAHFINPIGHLFCVGIVIFKWIESIMSDQMKYEFYLRMNATGRLEVLNLIDDPPSFR